MIQKRSSPLCFCVSVVYCRFLWRTQNKELDVNFMHNYLRDIKFKNVSKLCIIYANPFLLTKLSWFHYNLSRCLIIKTINAHDFRSLKILFQIVIRSFSSNLREWLLIPFTNFLGNTTLDSLIFILSPSNLKFY